MSSTYTASSSYTYSVADVENVVRNFAADFRMIAESSGTWSRSKVDLNVEDVTYLAKQKYIEFIDITLLNGLVEEKAVRYIVNEDSGELEVGRPGGVRWPRIDGARLRMVVRPTKKWATTPPDRSKLNTNWSDSSEDISHATLAASAGRNFTSSVYGFQRTDYSK